MKKSLKGLYTTGLLALGLVLLSGCTKSFCSARERSRMINANDKGCTFYFDESSVTYKEQTVATEEVGGEYTSLYKIVDIDQGFTKTIIENAAKSGLVIPTKEYWSTLDFKVLEICYSKYADNDPNPVAKADINAEKANEILSSYGYLKFTDDSSEQQLFDNFYKINSQIAIELGMEKAMSNDFLNLYVTTLNQKVANVNSCVATQDGYYGSFGENNESVFIDGKSWGDAFKIGFIEGLLVYPIGWLVDTFAHLFGYNNPNMAANGVPQILSILVVTIIVRGIILLISLKTTLGQQKMNDIQPELAKIQAKYPNSDTNTAQKQRLAQEQMALYKKHKINPLGSLVVLIFQFPIFIAVWSAMSGSAILSTGSVLGLKMSDSIGSVLTGYITNGGFTANAGGWWTALVLFLTMSAAQVVSSKLPQIIQKRKQKKLSKLTKNPAQDQNNKTMSIVTTVMMIMIIVMGFSLPSAMGFYWLIGAIISVSQTLIMEAISKNKLKKRSNK